MTLEEIKTQVAVLMDTTAKLHKRIYGREGIEPTQEEREEYMENENEETQKSPESNGVSTPEGLEAIKAQLEEEKKAKAAAEEALKNAKGELDIARAQSELAVMAAQIAALRKYRQKR